MDEALGKVLLDGRLDRGDRQIQAEILGEGTARLDTPIGEEIVESEPVGVDPIQLIEQDLPVVLPEQKPAGDRHALATPQRVGDIARVPEAENDRIGLVHRSPVPERETETGILDRSAAVLLSGIA